MNRLYLILLIFLGMFSLQCFAEGLYRPELESFDVFASGSKILEINKQKAVEMAMANNIALKVETNNPLIRATYTESQKAKFDSVVSAYFSSSDRDTKVIFQQGDLGNSVSNKTEAGISMSTLDHSGSTTSFDLSSTRNRSAKSSNFFSTRIGVAFDKPLRRGAGQDVNLVSLRQSELDLQWSKYELQGYVLNLIADLEDKYWDYYLCMKELKIMKESVLIAQRQKEETKRRIDVGSIPESEAAAAEAELMLRNEDLINAKSDGNLAAIAILRIINPDTENFWKIKPVIKDQILSFEMPKQSLDKLIAISLSQRPEIAQADIMLKHDRLEIVSTRNGLLPKLDLFIKMGKTGYSKSFAATNPKIREKGAYDVSAELVYEVSRGRRDAKAQHKRAQLNVKLRQEAIKNLEQIIKQEVINAYIEVKRTIQQIKATASTSEKQKEKLRVEQVKFSVGKTTSFQVAQAQRDLTEAKIAEVKAAVEHQQAFTELLRASGILLEHRNIILN